MWLRATNAILQKHLLPGMEIRTAAPAKPAQPLVYRCSCGVPLSPKWRRCKACHIQLLTDIGEQVLDNDLLDAVLSRNPNPGALLTELLPYLKFNPFEKSIESAADSSSV